MSQDQAIRDTIRELMAEVTQQDVSKITDDAPFEQFDIDSLTAAQLVAAIEDEYDITISDEDLPGLNCLNDLVTTVHRQLGNA